MPTARPLIAAVADPAPRMPAGPSTIRVVLVDGCPDVRFLLATVLELDRRFDVVAEASDSRSALDAVAATEPDVVLVDLLLDDGSGTEVISDLRQRGITACVVAMTACTTPHAHAAAFNAGADAVQDQRAMTSTMVSELAQLVTGRTPRHLVAPASGPADPSSPAPWQQRSHN